MRVSRFISAILTIVSLSACGLATAQRSAVSQFASASSAVGDLVTAELPHMRDAAMEMNATSVVLRGNADYRKLDEHFPVDVIAVRVSAGRALASYGQLLQALVEDTQKDQLTKASNHFVTSFKSIEGKKLTDNQYEALGTIVQAIGGLIVEYEKKQAIRKIVPQVQPDVEKLCDLFIADFSTTGLNLGQQLANDVDRLKVDVSVALGASGASFGDRSLAVQGQILADREGARAEQNSKNSQVAFTKLKQANDQLAKALLDETVSIEDIKALAKQIQTWGDAIRALAGK